MESIDATRVLASRTGNPQMPLSNRLHVRVAVLGNELEFTDERAGNKTETVNIQELVSAFTGVLKASSHPISTTPRFVKEDATDYGDGTETQKVKPEIVRLKQLVRKVEDENKHLQQLLQESKKENEQLKIRFRTATHMKAAEVAQRFSRVNAVPNSGNGDGPDSVTDSEESYESEQKPQDFVLNPQVKEIDFLSLDDILGDDHTVEPTSKRMTKDLVEEDDEKVKENSESRTRALSGNDEKYLDSPEAETFALPQATAPSVLKIGLDSVLARTGGKCRVEKSHGSPVRRSSGRRGRSNNHDSHAERENVCETEEELSGAKDISMVGMYGIMHKPSPNDGRFYKTVLIANLPLDINYHKLLVKVRGGDIISATLCDTTKLRGCGGHKSALVVFLSAEAATAYVQFANKHGICFDSQRAFVRLIETPVYPLSLPAERRIEYGQTRYLVILKFRSELSLSKIDRVINVGVNDYRADAIDRFWKDEDGNVRILFASISAASMAYWRLQTDPNYNRLKIKFEDDPCGRPLSDLLPTPTDRRSSDFGSMKLNYDDDEKDSDDENTTEIKTFIPPTSQKVKNADEVELEKDDNDIVNDKSTKEKRASDKMANEEPTADLETAAIESADLSEVTTIVERATVDPFEISARAKAAEATTQADEKPTETNHPIEGQDSKTSDFPNAESSHSIDNASEPQDVSNLEDPIAKDITVVEPITFSPTISQPLGPMPILPSNITDITSGAANGSLESWADDVIDAFESGTLRAPSELKPVLPLIDLTEIEEEIVYPLINFLPTIAEEDLSMIEPEEEESAVKASAEMLVVGSPITELLITELPVTNAAVAEVPVPALSTKKLAANRFATESFHATESSTPVVRMIPDKFDLTGTDLDPAFVAALALQTVVSQRPRGGLATSRYADCNTNATKPIIVECPLNFPTLKDSDRAASELLFGKSPAEVTPAPQPVSLPPLHAPKGPRGGVPAHLWVNPEISNKPPLQDQLVRMQKRSCIQASEQYTTKENQRAPVPKRDLTGPGFMPCKPKNGITTSRYAGLDPPAARPRSSLRDFYKAVDSQSMAPQSPHRAISAATDPQSATPGPETPSPGDDAAAESGTGDLESGVAARIHAAAAPPA